MVDVPMMGQRIVLACMLTLPWQEGKCHQVTTPLPNELFAPLAIFDNCALVGGAWQCTSEFFKPW